MIWLTANNEATYLANHGASVSTANAKVDASTKKKKKWKVNVFQHIISTIIDIAESMWIYQNKDCHHRKNGKAISTIVKVNRTIKRLYGEHNFVMPDDIDTCFDVDFDTHLNNSLHSKQSWITRWEKSIYVSVKRAKHDASLKTMKIWKCFDRNCAPHLFVCLHRVLKSSQDEAWKNRKRVLREQKLTSTQGFQIQPVERSTSTVPPTSQLKKYIDKHPSVWDHFC